MRMDELIVLHRSFRSATLESPFSEKRPDVGRWADNYGRCRPLTRLGPPGTSASGQSPRAGVFRGRGLCAVSRAPGRALPQGIRGVLGLLPDAEPRAPDPGANNGRGMLAF